MVIRQAIVISTAKGNVDISRDSGVNPPAVLCAPQRRHPMRLYPNAASDGRTRLMIGGSS